MNSVRSGKSDYFAAFILGALIALLIVAPARAADYFSFPSRNLNLVSAPVGVDHLGLQLASDRHQ